MSHVTGLQRQIAAHPSLLCSQSNASISSSIFNLVTRGVSASPLPRRRCLATITCSAEKRNRKPGHRFGLSLFHQFGDGLLPADGETLTPEEQCCDPYNSNCKTPLHVWEARCAKCHGTGTIKSYGSGSSRRGRGHGSRRTLSTCISCSGIGFVRQVSVEPPDDDDGSMVTLGRKPNEPFECKVLPPFQDFPEPNVPD